MAPCSWHTPSFLSDCRAYDNLQLDAEADAAAQQQHLALAAQAANADAAQQQRVLQDDHDRALAQVRAPVDGPMQMRPLTEAG